MVCWSQRTSDFLLNVQVFCGPAINYISLQLNYCKDKGKDTPNSLLPNYFTTFYYYLYS